MRLATAVAAGCLVYGVALAQEGPALTPISLQAALAAKPEGAEAERLAERIRTYFGGSESLVKGAPAKIDELTVAWALEAPQLAANAPAPRVAWDPGNLHPAAHESRHERALRRDRHAGAWHGVQLALRGGRPAVRRRTGRGL